MVAIQTWAKILLITLIGGVLRFWDLGVNPVWVDEGIFAHFARDNMFYQEYFTVWLVRTFNLFNDEFSLRFIFALAGTLTIPAVYYVVKHHKLEASLFVALFPMFIFWSRQARPYAFCGLFMVLGWRWWWFNIISIVNMPLSFIGVHFKKDKYIVVLFLLTLWVYFSRQDVSGTEYAWSWGIRFLYLPLLAGVLWITEYNFKEMKYYIHTIIAIFLFCFFSLPARIGWYDNGIKPVEGWRTAGDFDFATNAHVSNFYNSRHKTWELKTKWMPLIQQRLELGHSLRIGLDRIAYNVALAYSIIPMSVVMQYKDRFDRGEVVRLLVDKNGYVEY